MDSWKYWSYWHRTRTYEGKGEESTSRIDYNEKERILKYMIDVEPAEQVDDETGVAVWIAKILSLTTGITGAPLMIRFLETLLSSQFDIDTYRICIKRIIGCKWTIRIILTWVFAKNRFNMEIFRTTGYSNLKTLLCEKQFDKVFRKGVKHAYIEENILFLSKEARNYESIAEQFH